MRSGDRSAASAPIELLRDPLSHYLPQAGAAIVAPAIRLAVNGARHHDLRGPLRFARTTVGRGGVPDAQQGS